MSNLPAIPQAALTIVDALLSDRPEMVRLASIALFAAGLFVISHASLGHAENRRGQLHVLTGLRAIPKRTLALTAAMARQPTRVVVRYHRSLNRGGKLGTYGGGGIGTLCLIGSLILKANGNPDWWGPLIPAALGLSQAVQAFVFRDTYRTGGRNAIEPPDG